MYKYILIVVALCSCYTVSAGKKEKKQDIEILYDLMSGSYSSQKQSEKDSSYFDIRLQIKPMWQNKKGEYWLYVEQAMSTTMDKPYRQRVYQVVQINDSTFASKVYTIKNGEKYFGDYKKKSPLAQLTPADLEDRIGCAVMLKKIGDKKFLGSTNNKDCESNLKGAKYATSEVKITKEKIVSWDRGFDATDKQVWGAVKGGYVFKKLKKSR